MFLTASALYASLARPVEGQDQCDEDIVYPPEAVVGGKDMGEWVAEWWKWIGSIPKDVNPLLDLTGARCAMDQPHQDVFFLVATIGGTEDKLCRTECKAPAGKPIFLPIWPVVAWSPGDCPPNMLDDCGRLIDGIIETLVGLKFSLVSSAPPRCEGPEAGREIRCLEDHRHRSPWFDLTIPADNLFDIPEPLTRKFLGDGFWLMLKPLEPGTYTIAWKGTLRAIPTEYITYELTVEAGDAATFRRGDSDANGSVNLTDAVAILGRLFQGQDPLPCDDAADGNDDGGLNITDAVYILDHLFRGGPAPPAPGPADCGPDPSADALDCAKGC